MNYVEGRLKKASIRGVNKEGVSKTLQGIEVSWGMGNGAKDADINMAKNKIERQLSGLRSERGEKPPWLIETEETI